MSSNRYICLNKSGQIVFSKKKYLKIEDFHGGVAKVVTKNGKKKYINKKGKVVKTKIRERKYDLDVYQEIMTIAPYEVTRDCGEGYIKVKTSNDRWGCLNAKKKLVILCQYKSIGKFWKGVACVVDFDYRCGLINHDGKEIIPCKYKLYCDGTDVAKLTLEIALFLGFDFSEGLLLLNVNKD